MKRAIGLILISFLCAVGFLSVWGNVPFAPVFDSSMEPELQSGSLLVIRSVEVANIEEGDIIVANVPDAVRKDYNYPPTIAHRVVEIKGDQLGISLQTRGINAYDDPFLVMPWNIRGTVGSQIPYLGLPLLILQNRLAMVFIIVVIVLLALFLYANEISLGIGRIFRNTLSPIVEENHRTDLVLSHRFESTERALDNFANAMQLYAQHMASHTSAIQGLSDASQSLRGSAAEQNRILGHLTKAYIQEKSKREVSTVERVVKEIERKTIEALQAKDELEKKIPGQFIRPREEQLLREILQSPPGCVVNPKALIARAHYR
jgi:signal peptidase I